MTLLGSALIFYCGKNFGVKAIWENCEPGLQAIREDCEPMYPRLTAGSGWLQVPLLSCEKGQASSAERTVVNDCRPNTKFGRSEDNVRDRLCRTGYPVYCGGCTTARHNLESMLWFEFPNKDAVTA